MWLINHRHLFLTVLEAESPRSRHWQIQCLVSQLKGEEDPRQVLPAQVLEALDDAAAVRENHRPGLQVGRPGLRHLLS